MAKSNLFRVAFVLLALMCTAAQCNVEEMTADQMAAGVEKLSVDNVAEWQAEKRANGPECNLFFIKGNKKHNFSLYLEQLHACSPKEEDAQKHAELLLDAIKECTVICVNGFADGSDGQDACTEQCRGGYEGSLTD